MTREELTASAEAMLMGMAHRPAGMSAEEWLGRQIGAQIERVLAARERDIAPALQSAREAIDDIDDFIDLSDEYDAPQTKAKNAANTIRKAIAEIEGAGR